MAHVVILGAGLTGISAAYHLEQQGIFDYVLCEKEQEIGGLCNSIEQDGFTFDFTGHLLHISDPYVLSLVKSLVGMEHFNAITRRSFIFSHQTYTKYPFQINLFGLPVPIIAECVKEFIKRPHLKNPRSFYQWVMTTFGAGFGRHFFFTYQRKIFAYDIKKITASWTGRFVPSTTLEQIIEGALTDSQAPSVGYNATFFYPRQGGIVSWVKKIASHLVNPIKTRWTALRIDLKNNIVHFANGHAEPFTHLISTIPLDILLTMTQDLSSTAFYQAHSKLLCNTVINFNLGVNRPDLCDKHWIYFPENAYPFYRLGFPHNFASSMAPAGCSSLYGEFAHIRKSRAWINHTLQHALASTKKLLNIDKHDILTEKIISIPHAYVIYNNWREQQLPVLLERLKEHNILSTGRYGAWKYASMQEAVLDGKEAAIWASTFEKSNILSPSMINQEISR